MRPGKQAERADSNVIVRLAYTENLIVSIRVTVQVRTGICSLGTQYGIVIAKTGGETPHAHMTIDQVPLIELSVQKS